MATETKPKPVISAAIIVALDDYMTKVDRYTALTNDDYDTDFAFALDEIEDAKRVLNRILRSADRV